MPLREDAEAIWKAGVAAVDSAAAVHRHIQSDQSTLRVADLELSLASIDRIEIVGAGKAGAGMAQGLESAVLPWIDPTRISGWVNVPADCVRSLQRIHLHAARPAGINEPTAEGVKGTNEILRRVQSLAARDVCIVLLSGGASALLCSPVPEISLADKLAVTRALAASGAPIQELNLVRTQISQVKGGRLAAACKAGALIALIISDVIGDPLEVIGSGPTVPAPWRAAEALEILSARGLIASVPDTVTAYLRSRINARSTTSDTGIRTRNIIVASNSIALDAAAAKAKQLGYQIQSMGSANAGVASAEGRRLMQQLLAAKTQRQSDGCQPLCVLSGGEPTVDLTSGMAPTASAELPKGKGGRNQELVLSAISAFPNKADWSGVALLSGGTDGEDGPTDAAGAYADSEIIAATVKAGLDAQRFLLNHDSYNFFAAVNGLLKTGPTHTNVMDLRVGLANPSRE